MEAARPEGQDLDGRAAQIAPGFQQPKSEVLGGADAFRESLTKQATVSDQLTEQMGNLQEEVEDFGGGRVLSVNVFQRVAPTFLIIEAFILNLPAEPTS